MEILTLLIRTDYIPIYNFWHILITEMKPQIKIYKISQTCSFKVWMGCDLDIRYLPTPGKVSKLNQKYIIQSHLYREFFQ